MSQARKGTRGTRNTGTRSYYSHGISRLWTGLSQQGLETPPHKQGHPDRAMRGARTGTGSGRARVSPTMTTPDHQAVTVGRACKAPGSSRVGPTGIGARRARSGDPEAAAEGGCLRDVPWPLPVLSLSASEGLRWRRGGDNTGTTCQSECESPTLSSGTLVELARGRGR